MIASEGSLWEALATLYVAWGSTYLAIRVLVESVLPVLASGVRFVAAGALLALVIAARGGLARFRVGRREALSAARASALTIAAAFSLLFLGETEVPAVCEAVGSFIAQRVRLPGDLLVSAALQMLFGGAVTVLVAVAIGELGDVGAVPLDGVLAFLYLVLPGSVLAYTAYVWLLRHVPLSIATTYAYVNPVVAVFLGWAVLSEKITATLLVGAVAIVASVALVVRAEGR